MKPLLTVPMLPKLIKYSSISVVALSLISPSMAIERPTPAKQPTEQKTANPLGKDNVQVDKITYLGVYGVPVSEALATHLHLKKAIGIELELIAPNSPASKATLKKSDIILKIGEKDISNMIDVQEAIIGKKAGDQVDIVFISSGKKMVKNVTLADRFAPKIIKQHQPKLEDELGDFLNNQDMLKMGLPQELLEQFPEKDRERLLQLFEGGASPNNLEEIEQQLGELNEIIPDEIQELPQVQENIKGHFRSRVKMINQYGSITLESTNDGKIIVLKDKQGKVKYRGHYNNEEDKLKIPKKLRNQVDDLDLDNKMKLLNKSKP